MTDREDPAMELIHRHHCTLDLYDMDADELRDHLKEHRAEGSYADTGEWPEDP